LPVANTTSEKAGTKGTCNTLGKQVKGQLVTHWKSKSKAKGNVLGKQKNGKVTDTGNAGKKPKVTHQEIR